VTINYRLGALGFLAHPALASQPGGPAGNYGLMDQQAALRWVRRNIEQFGGDPHNVTIAGQSAGGLSVLAHLVSTGSRGLFQRAIVESGAFALDQLPLATAESAGTAFAAQAGCPDQSAKCLRRLPVADLVDSFPASAIPGNPPDPTALPSGCAFHPRCVLAEEVCTQKRPGLSILTGGHRAACLFADEVSIGVRTL